MRKLLLSTTFLLVALPAWANPGEPGYLGPPVPTTHQLNVSSLATAKAQARAQAKAAAIAAGGAATSSTSASYTNTGGNVRIRQEAGANPSALGGLSSGPCTGASGGITVAVPVVGVGIQGGGMDDQCTLRNNILIMQAINPRVARQMATHLEGAERALKEICADPHDADDRRFCAW